MQIFRIFNLFLLIFSGVTAYTQVAEHLSTEINSEYEEREPTFSQDGKTMYFWRRKSPANIAGIRDNGDIWVSKLVNNKWTMATHPSGDVLNSPQQNFVWQVSKNHDTLWTNRILYVPGQKDAGLGYHLRDGYGNWQPQRHMEIENYDFVGQYKDYFIGPGRVLLITNVTEEGLGGTDLWVAFPQSDTTWGTPVNLGALINTPGDEDAPFLANDGKTLYFGSNGHGTGGDHDVYYTTRLDNTWKKWSKPKPVGKPINGIGYDYDFQLSPDGKYAYWCTDQNTYGGNDIFRLDLFSCDLTLYPEGNLSLCRGDSAVLEAGFGLDNPSYRWLRNGTPITGAFDRVYVARETGAYQVVRVKKACSDTSDIRIVHFKDVPSVSITSQSPFLCENDSVLLMAFSQEGNTYQWQRNGKAIYGAVQAKYYTKMPGEYSIKVSNGNCIRYSEVISIERLKEPFIYHNQDITKEDSISEWKVLTYSNYSPKDYSFRSLQRDNIGNTYMVGILDEKNARTLRVDVYDKKGNFKWENPQKMRRHSSQTFAALDENSNLFVSNNDNYLIKYGINGSIIWQKDYMMEMVCGVATDVAGNVITTGRFRDTLNIDNQEFIPGVRGNIYVAKHSPGGKLLWLRSISADKAKDDFGNMIGTDCIGNIYVAGKFERIANFVNPVLRISSLDDHFFIAKYTPDGRLTWAKKFTSPHGILSTGDFSVDCTGNTYLLANNKFYKINTYGSVAQSYQLKLPDLTKKARMHIVGEKAYIGGLISVEEDYFFMEVNSKTGEQKLIWQGKHAKEDSYEIPCMSHDEEGNVYFGGVVKGKASWGSSPAQKTGASVTVSAYGMRSPSFSEKPVQLCDGDTFMLYSQLQQGLSVQWLKNGKAIANAVQSTIEATQSGVYQLVVKSKNCTLQSNKISLNFDCKQNKKPEIIAENPPQKEKTVIEKNKPKEPIKTETRTATTSPPKNEAKIKENSPKKNIEPDLITASDGSPKSLKKRKVKLQNDFTVENNKLRISVWDYAAMDNDTISLNVNGIWVLTHYGLTKKKKTLVIEFDPAEENYIVMYAHNLGAIPPNTVTISIDDGINEQVSKLESDLRNCGYLRIRMKK